MTLSELENELQNINTKDEKPMFSYDKTIQQEAEAAEAAEQKA